MIIFGKKHKSSALLLSFFLMSSLILISLAVSYLVLKDMQSVRTIIGGRQAKYASEGMTEKALAMIKVNLPGLEYTLEPNDSIFESSRAGFEIEALNDEIPCSNQTSESWLKLSKNESIQIPLFYQIAEGSDETQAVDDFFVQFFIGDKDGNSFQRRISIDVLRWKIIGFTSNDKTEAISEFIPPNPSESYTSLGTNAAEVADPKYRQGKYTSNGGFTANMEISTFLQNHSYNYLVLTNVFENSDYYIHFKLKSSKRDLPCPYVRVKSTATNDFAEARQSLNTFMKEGENLPVYDFVLYNTKEK